MSGHLFITRGDLRRLACDAIVIPSGAWEGRLGHVGNSVWHDIGLPLDPGHFVPHAPTQDRRAVQIVEKVSIQEPGLWVAHTGDDHYRDPEWYAEALVFFVRAAADQLGAQPEDVQHRPLGDPRPLLGVPLVGTGQGGMEDAKGEVVTAVVRCLCDALSEVDADVALVLAHDEAHAAAQQVRLRLYGDSAWPETTGLSTHADELAQRARRGEIVLFVGAGASMGAGSPSWSGLLEKLATSHATREEVEELLRLDARDAAAVLERRYGSRDALADAVVTATDARRVALVHQLLASLPVNEAATTNYDTCFESAWMDAGRSARVLPREPAAGSRNWLLKLHGSVDDRARIVLSRDDYLRFEGEGVALAGVVQAMLLTRHMLFVGYSLSDDNFHRLMHQVRSTLGARDSRPGAERFATALIATPGKLAHEIWDDDVNLVSTSDDDRTGPRRLAMLLDQVNAEAAAPAAHMLDDSYRALFTEGEAELRDALLDVWFAARNGGIPAPVRVAVETALSQIGPAPAGRRLSERARRHTG